MQQISKLIFVYNANSGTVNSLIGTAHKILKPETYSCSLCALTFGKFTEKTSWKRFRKQHAIPMRFLHKDQFLKQYKSKWLPAYTFPIILVEENNSLTVLITTQELAQISDTKGLINLMNTKLTL